MPQDFILLWQQPEAARKLIGARTFFNIVGPLSNPCTNLSGQVIGVTDASLFERISEASLNLGIRNIMVDKPTTA